VNSNDQPVEGLPPTPQEKLSVSAEPDPSMQEYYSLQKELFVATLTFTAGIFGVVWYFYSLNIALNYLLGAIAGIIYLLLLARDVEQLGRESQKLNQSRLAVFVALIIAAISIDQLRILPVFLGFLTYKATLLYYIFRTTVMPSLWPLSKTKSS
jgi:ATP synthase protein I